MQRPNIGPKRLAHTKRDGILSGLKLNESKTKALWLGPWKQRAEKPLNFIWTKEPL